MKIFTKPGRKILQTSPDNPLTKTYESKLLLDTSTSDITIFRRKSHRCQKYR
jgi:hypothetical protein